MSRDTEIYKDKVEVNLDSRQIFYLFFGGSVIVGMVFVLGVMVGRRVEARGYVERAHVEATLDPLAALDRLEGSGGLSFAATLRGAVAVPSPVDKLIDAKQADKPESKLASKPDPKVEARADAKSDVKDVK